MSSIHKMIILLAFISVAVFGFLAMGGGHHAPMHNCIAALAGSAPCPDNDPLGYASFHLDFFKTFSSTVDSGLTLLIIALAVLALSIFTLRMSDIPVVLKIRASYSLEHSVVFDTYHRRFFRWLSFHENSPSSLLGNTV